MDRRVGLGLVAAVAPAQTWRQVGPPGGTVISLAADSKDANKLYLGTSDGHVFSSNDEGGHWQLLSRIGTGQDDVITHILVDPRNSNHFMPAPGRCIPVAAACIASTMRDAAGT